LGKQQGLETHIHTYIHASVTLASSELLWQS
jgi:hypothetical protein